MPRIIKTSAGTWKALIRLTGWPVTTNAFRTKRDAEDWACGTENETLHCIYI